MKNEKMFLIMTFILCIFAILFAFFDFLALHDIKKDYVSHSILKYLKIDIQEDLPKWTKTKSEWRLIVVSYLIRVVFLIFALTYLMQKLIKKGEN